MRAWLKSKLHYIIILVLLGICTRMFVQNYELQQPVVSKHQKSWATLSAELSDCNSKLPENQPDGMSASNKKAVENWNKPVEE